MRAPSSWVDAVEAVQRAGPIAVVLRAAVVVGGLVCVVATGLVGDPKLELVVIALVAVCAAAARPDSITPMVAVIALTVQWLQAVRPFSAAASIVLAVCVLLVHAASARVATLPYHAPIDVAATRRWAAQCGVVGLVTGLVWALVVLLDDESPGGATWATLGGLAALVAFGLALLLVAAPGQRSEPGP